MKSAETSIQDEEKRGVTAKKFPGWTRTNSTEWHLRNANGKIVGKIRRGYWYNGDRWDQWQCSIHTPRLLYIGDRKSLSDAQRFVERSTAPRRIQSGEKP